MRREVNAPGILLCVIWKSKKHHLSGAFTIIGILGLETFSSVSLWRWVLKSLKLFTESAITENVITPAVRRLIAPLSYLPKISGIQQSIWHYLRSYRSVQKRKPMHLAKASSAIMMKEGWRHLWKRWTSGVDANPGGESIPTLTDGFATSHCGLSNGCQRNIINI